MQPLYFMLHYSVFVLLAIRYFSIHRGLMFLFCRIQPGGDVTVQYCALMGFGGDLQ